MKKFRFILAALAMGFALNSCSSDDDNTNDNDSIVGKWNFVSERYYINGNLEFDGPYSENQPGCLPDFLQFTNNGRASQGQYDESCGAEIYTGDYTRSGNTITLDDDGGTVSLQIVAVNLNTLVLKNTYEYDGDTEVSEITFSKAQ